jgi:hypothetical protein
LGYRHALPVRSAVLLLRREADSPGLTGEYRLQFPGEEPYQLFRYQVVRLWQVPLQPLLAGPLGTLPLAPLTDEAESVLPAVVARVNDRLRHEASQTDAEKLLTATVVLMGLRYPVELAEQLLKGVSGMEESATYQWIVSKGQIKEAKRFLLMQGQDRFGQPDPKTVAAIESISDLGRLEELGRRLLRVDSWEELFSPDH